MGRAIRASVLILLLTCTAQAGYMQNGTPQPPPPPQATQEPTTQGVVLTPPLVEFALSLLALF